MFISDNRINNITHAVAAILEVNGIALNDNLKCDLNESLSDFLKEYCACERVQEDERPANTCQIALDVTTATVCQNVEIINPEYTEETIIEGLQSGRLITTLGHGDCAPHIIVNETDEKIASIQSQEIDGEYVDYR